MMIIVSPLFLLCLMRVVFVGADSDHKYDLHQAERGHAWAQNAMVRPLPRPGMTILLHSHLSRSWLRALSSYLVIIPQGFRYHTGGAA